MLNPQIRDTLGDMGVRVDAIRPLVRRSDPMDREAGAHLKIEPPVSLYQADDLVVKVGPAGKLDAYAKEHRVLGYLQERGFNAPASPTLPRQVGRHAVALTTYVPHDPTATPEPERTGALLAQLHQIPAPDWLSPDRSLLRNVQTLIAKPSLSAAVREALVGKCVPNEAALAEQNRASSRLCHGDLHLGNILPHKSGAQLIDFEASASGHPLWDIARLTQANKRFGLDTAWYQRLWNTWQEHTGFTGEELQPFVDWRSWYGVVNLLGRASLSHDERSELANRLKWAQYGTENEWTRI
jgi:Ser/Thr protein kinase RdoA (MazF antagonist)